MSPLQHQAIVREQHCADMTMRGKDRSDFVRFNFPPDDTLPGDAPRPPLIASEAMCLLLMRVRVAGIEPPGEGDHKDYPVVHFAGVSRVIDEFNGDGSVDSELRGTVRMTPEGEVRWTTSTIYSGQERWKSEGIQLGGIRSARGVVGTWFHKYVSVSFSPRHAASWALFSTNPTAPSLQGLRRARPLWADGLLEGVGQPGQGRHSPLSSVRFSLQP